MKVGINIITVSSIFLLLICDGVADSFQCTLCDPDTFCFEDVEQNCPTHSISFFGADNITDCVCKSGYYRNNHECILCPINNFCPGDQTVHFCPANAISLAGAVNISMCLCDKGFAQQDAPVCISCSEGKYKDFVGNQLCIACPSNTYNTNQQSIHVDNCESCPTLTVSQPTSINVQQCVSDVGAFSQTNNPFDAQLCPPGTYQDETNQTVCKQCNLMKYQSNYGEKTEAACLSCPSFATIQNGPGVQVSDCICNRGFTGTNGGPCSECPAGTYKSTLGSEECLETPINTFSLSGSTMWEECPLNSSSYVASTNIGNCSCHAGFFLKVLQLNPYDVQCQLCLPGFSKDIKGNFDCYECEAGTFSSGVGNTGCTQCSENTYSYANQDTCSLCKEHQYSLPGSVREEECGCNAGYDYVNNSCQLCAIGKYRGQDQTITQVNRNSDTCVFCDNGKYTLATGSQSLSDCRVCASNKYIDVNWNCVDCVDFSTSTHQSHGYESCVCNAGYTKSESNLCTACIEGKYKSLPGDQECTTCAIGKNGVGGQGSTSEEAQCVECPANSYGEIDQIINSYGALDDHAICVQCNLNSVSLPGSTSVNSCVCDAGYSQLDQNCLPCVGSYFKETIGNQACVPCDLQSFTNVTGSTSCLNCPANSERLNVDSTLNIESCVCKPGFTGNNGKNCIQCNPGTFKTIYGSTPCAGCGAHAYFPEVHITNVNYCKACPAHSTSLTGHAFGIAECTCQQGFYRFDNVTCVQCFNNHYCPGEHDMFECPANTQSPSGSHTISQCTCNAGYYGQSWNLGGTQSEVAYSNCTLCPVNTHCVGGAENPIVCMNNATTQGKLGSKNITSCICNPGYYESIDNLIPSCKLCPRDSYCHLDSVWSCPPDSSASTQSTSVEDCLCNSGLKLDTETQTCVSCAQNEVCFADGTVQVCAQNATNNNQHCLCQTGTYCDGSDRNSNSNSSCLHDQICSLCPKDTYCAMNKMIECDLNEVSAPGSIISSQCRCAEGFYRVSGECMQCLDNHFCTNEQKYPSNTYDSNLITISHFNANQKIFFTSSTYLNAGAASVFDAVCTTGMFRTATTDLCKPCPLDHFCPSEYTMQLPNVVHCPENEFTYTIASSSRVECICLAGFKLSSTSLVTKCLPCEIGERCQGGLVVEEQCHIQNKVANSDHSACVCHIGYGFYNFECQQCPPGSIKSEIGDFECTYCGINEYAENTTTCIECPINSVARPGSTQCFCTAPFVWNGEKCILCDNSYYRGEIIISQNEHSGICLKCPVNASNVASATMKSGITACTCSRGFNKYPQNVSNEFVCVPCSQGYYEDDGVCKQCKENAWSYEGSFGEQSCTCNQINVTTCHSKLLDGTCQGECANPPKDCTQCTVGYYKNSFSDVGNEDNCQACAISTFQSLVGQTSCVDCPQFSRHYELAVTTKNTCKCIPGFTLDLNTSSCQACKKGHYKDFRGDESCLPCQIGTYNPHSNATNCFSCFEATKSNLTFHQHKNIESLYYTQEEIETITDNSLHLVMQSNTTLYSASTSLYDCTCQAGQQAVDLNDDNIIRKCDHCVPGTFKADKGFDACMYCGTIVDEYGAQYKHHYGDENAGATDISHCLPCPSFSGQEAHLIGPDGYIMNDITDCKCFRGHENRTLHSCTNCSDYMVQPLFSDNDCVFCDSGYYFVHSSLECQICNLAASDGSTHTGFVSNILDSTFTWGSSQYDCVCNLGYERLIEECSPCLPGFFRNDIILRVCQSCPLDTYQPDHLSTSCNDCPANSQTQGAHAQTSIYECICNAGYDALKILDDNGECKQCQAGTYRTNRTREEFSQDCIECPENHYCPIGSIFPIACPSREQSDKRSEELADCECSSGRGRNNGRYNECSDCPPGSFATSRNNVECTLCPENKNTSVGALSLEECKCIPGHGISGTDFNGDCSPCLDGFFAIGGNNIACVHCGFGTVTEPPIESFHSDSCLCDARIGLYEIN